MSIHVLAILNSGTSPAEVVISPLGVKRKGAPLSHKKNPTHTKAHIRVCLIPKKKKKQFENN